MSLFDGRHSYDRLWPKDPSGHVFILRAVHEYGARQYGEVWSDKELTARPMVEAAMPIITHFEWPEHLQRKASDITARPRLQPGALSWEVADADFAFERAVKQRASENNSEAAAPILRLLTVGEALVAKCEAGEIRTAYRERVGGRLHAMEAALWSTERWIGRILAGVFDPADPFADASEARSPFIFLDRSDFDRWLLQRFRPAAPHDRGLAPHLSPYMDLALLVARELEITPDNQPSNEVMYQTIEARWPAGIDFSENLRNAMATLLRQPENQKGGAPGSRKAKK